MTAFNPQDPMRQQQALMRKQQEDLRRRQQMAAWGEQKKAHEKGQQPVTDQFTKVEKEAAWLRQERAAGRLNEEAFKAQLKELMFQDESGVWWMVGQQSGEWYRNEGGQWVRAKPAVSSAVPGAPPPTMPGEDAVRKGHRGLGCAVLALGLAGSFVLGMTQFPHRVVAPLIGFALGPQQTIFLVWGLGALVTVLVASKVWRG